MTSKIEEKEMERKESANGLSFIGYVDLPKEFKKEYFLKNIGLAMFTICAHGLTFDPENALKEKRESNGTTTRMTVEKEFYEKFWSSLVEEYRNVYNMSDLIWFCLMEIKNNPKRYFD